jgi:hypothetical protein
MTDDEAELVARRADEPKTLAIKLFFQILEADDLAHDAECALEELHSLLNDPDEEGIIPLGKAQVALLAVRSLQDAIGRWQSSLIDDDKDEEDSLAPPRLLTDCPACGSQIGQPLHNSEFQCEACSAPLVREVRIASSN